MRPIVAACVSFRGAQSDVGVYCSLVFLPDILPPSMPSKPFFSSHYMKGLGGIGAFFRVGFWGALPAELKGLEFVYRVPLMTQFSDFQNRVLQLIYPLVPDPTKV